MDTTLFLRGYAIGLPIAAAIGPIALLVIRRTVTDGGRIGLASGLAVATGDATYGAVAAFGLTAVTTMLVGIRTPLALVGGLVLVGLGLSTLRANHPVGRRDDVAADALGTRRATSAADAGGSRSGPAAAFLSVLGLTLTNPMTIVSFASAFAGLGVGDAGPVGATLVTAGVFAGSATWWLVLVGVITRVKTRITSSAIRIVNAASSVVVVAFGIALVLSALGR